jgi:hypothetical protein
MNNLDLHDKLETMPGGRRVATVTNQALQRTIFHQPTEMAGLKFGEDAAVRFCP